jgi:hypothetical protein
MKKYLLAAVAALALGGSALANDDPRAGAVRLVGLLAEASQRCDASYDSEAMSNLSALILNELQHQGITKEGSAAWFNEGALKFDNEVLTNGLKFACDNMGTTVAKARATYNRNHQGGVQ